MAKLSASQIVNQYLGISDLEFEAQKRRARVVRLAKTGKVDKDILADLIGITVSGLDQLIRRYEKDHADML